MGLSTPFNAYGPVEALAARSGFNGENTAVYAAVRLCESRIKMS